MDVLSLPQIWLIAGLLLLFAELVSVSLVFIFFAVAAFITALLAATGLIPSGEHQLILFSVISVVTTLILRKPAKRWVNKSKQKEYTEYSGETAMVISDIPAKGEGRIFYRGAEWTALSANHVLIEAGSKVTIVKADGIKLLVEEEA
jgi:membrane protein implicated in regulation of membrane protease activity